MRKSSCVWHRPACVASRMRVAQLTRSARFVLAKRLIKEPNRTLVRAMAVRYWLQKRPELVEHLTREDDAGCAHGQAGNAQSLRRPGVPGVTEIVCSGRGIEDALRKGAGFNRARRPLLVGSQVVPQELRETFDARPRRRDCKSIGSTEERFRRNLERDDKHYCRSWGG